MQVIHTFGKSFSLIHLWGYYGVLSVVSHVWCHILKANRIKWVPVPPAEWHEYGNSGVQAYLSQGLLTDSFDGQVFKRGFFQLTYESTLWFFFT